MQNPHSSREARVPHYQQHEPNQSQRYNPRETVLILEMYYTRKNAQVTTNLQQTCGNAVPTTCQQDIFALLVPSLLQGC
jgi:hypothetical protein